MVLGLIGIVVIASVLFALQKHATTQPGRALAKKFANLGTLAGKTKHEIVQAVGQPTSVSALPGEQTLLQWQATGYHIALSFTGDVCNGVTHEYLAQD